MLKFSEDGHALYPAPSVLSFAAFLNCGLLLNELIDRRKIRKRDRLLVFRVIHSFAERRQVVIPDPLFDVPVADIVALLLKRGFAKKLPPKKLTPLQVLFTIFPPSTKIPVFVDDRASFFLVQYKNILEVLLMDGQSPNASVFEFDSNPDFMVIRKPLHVSRGPVTRLLLDNGADVNALASDGRTPLDWLLKSDDIIEPERWAGWLESVTSLIENGGCLTDVTRHDLQLPDQDRPEQLRIFSQLRRQIERIPKLPHIQRWRGLMNIEYLRHRIRMSRPLSRDKILAGFSPNSWVMWEVNRDFLADDEIMRDDEIMLDSD